MSFFFSLRRFDQMALVVVLKNECKLIRLHFYPEHTSFFFIAVQRIYYFVHFIHSLTLFSSVPKLFHQNGKNIVWIALNIVSISFLAYFRWYLIINYIMNAAMIQLTLESWIIFHFIRIFCLNNNNSFVLFFTRLTQTDRHTHTLRQRMNISIQMDRLLMSTLQEADKWKPMWKIFSHLIISISFIIIYYLQWLKIISEW